MGKAENKQDGFGRAMAELFGKSKSTAAEPAQQDTPITQQDFPIAPPPPPSVQSAPSAASPAPESAPVVSEPAPVVTKPAPVPPPPPPEPRFADVGVPPRRENTTYFAAGTVIEGTLRSDSDVEIVGDFSGEIVSDGMVTIHANTTSSIAAKDLMLVGATLTGDVTVSGDVVIDGDASLTGNIRAANVDSNGPIRGNLNVSGLVELKGSASLTGDVRTAQMTMERGVKVNGRVDVGMPQAKAAKN